MKFLILFLALVAVASANPGNIGVGYAAPAVAAAPVVGAAYHAPAAVVGAAYHAPAVAAAVPAVGAVHTGYAVGGLGYGALGYGAGHVKIHG